jgi:hypothetical protein
MECEPTEKSQTWGGSTQEQIGIDRHCFIVGLEPQICQNRDAIAVLECRNGVIRASCWLPSCQGLSGWFITIGRCGQISSVFLTGVGRQTACRFRRRGDPKTTVCFTIFDTRTRDACTRVWHASKPISFSNLDHISINYVYEDFVGDDLDCHPAYIEPVISCYKGIHKRRTLLWPSSKMHDAFPHASPRRSHISESTTKWHCGDTNKG